MKIKAFIVTTIFFSLIMINTDYAGADEKVESGCAPWVQSVTIDDRYLEKLEKKVAKEKGEDYSKDRIVFMLGNDPASIKQVLERTRNYAVEKTKKGRLDLRSVDLNGFDLSGLNFDKADLSKADLRGANLSNATLKGAVLYKADLTGANLNGADLSYANLESAELENASLCGTSLVSAELEDAEIVGGYYKDAKLDRAKNIPPILYRYSDAILKYGLVVPPAN